MSAGQSGNSYSRAPRILMDELVYQKIMYWVNKSNYEVSGLGKIVIESDGTIRIIEAMLLPQKNTHTTTDIEGADVGKLAYEMRDTPGELQFWWHSHANMNVFWSGTDLETIRALAQGGHFVCTVFNKKNETKTCIAMNLPFPLLFDNIQLEVISSIDADLLSKWDNEYEQKVINCIPKPSPVATPVYRGSSHHPQASTPVFSQEEREAIMRLAQEMQDDEEDTLPDFGTGAFGDSDSAISRRSGRELERGSVTPQEVLLLRDKMEEKVDRLEKAVETLEENGRKLPDKLVEALTTAQCDLNELDDELDVLEEHGIISSAERYSDRAWASIQE